MKSDFFIDRPVFSTVLSVIIVIVGFIGLALLPVDQYPKIVPPTVRITASYPGANAQTVTQAVATPIEQQLNGTPGMLYMESTCSNSGGFSCVVTFDIRTNPDLAAVEIQNRVKLAESRLPAEVVTNGLSVEKEASGRLMTITLLSDTPKFDEVYLSNYATLNVLDMLRRVPGVGRVSNVGSRYYAMKIWVEPDKLANYGLTIKDIQSAIRDQNRESAAGVLGQAPADGIDLTIPITAQGRLSTVSQFEDIVVRAYADGSIIRLRDLARVSLEASSYNTESGINGGNAAVMNISLLPGANAMDVAASVRAAMEDISRNFPEGIRYMIPFDVTEYISNSIHHVFRALIEALLLVILVVFLALQNWRATLIPIVAVPISLIGTFGVMLAFGFSLNLMTLLGLILAIGIVVDDAIVVVENVDHIMRTEGLSAYEATKKAMRNLGGALIAMSLVLCAVFVPVSFLGGITGQLYRQFTITIAVSVIISTVVALTLSPVLCSRLLRPEDPDRPKAWLFRKINAWIETGSAAYQRGIRYTLNHSRRFAGLFVLMLLAILLLHRVVPTSFMSKEDQGYFTVELELPEGATLERTRRVTERAMDYLLQHEDVQYVLNVTGSSPRIGTNQGRSTLTVILKPWEERENTDMSRTMAEVRAEFSRYPECKVYLTSPPVIPGLGSSGGVEMVLEARSGLSYERLQQAVDTLVLLAGQRKELVGVSASMQQDIPQLYFDVDRDRAQLLGVPMADIFSTIKTFTGSLYINDFNLFNRVYRVEMQAEAPYRIHKDNLNLFFVRGSSGAMIPITTLGTAEYTTGAGAIQRFNMFNAATIQAEAAQGYSTGHVMAILSALAQKHLPAEVGVEWKGLSYQEKHAGGKTGLVLALAFLFVFLFLAAQYESWSVPVAVILSLPVGVFGAYLGVWLCGMENNVYFQIGLVMLIGLVAKNAILIVEFAKEEVEKGSDAVSAALKAAALRFRPILMTSMAFILGLLPLVFASGPGAESRRDIGTGVFFGMLVALFTACIIVPYFFVWVYRLKARFSARPGAALKGLTVWVAAAALFAGCTMQKYCPAPDGALPDEVVRPEIMRGGAAMGQGAGLDTLAFSDVEWWTLYADTVLNRLIRHALEHNRDMRVAIAKIRELRYTGRGAIMDQLPKVSAFGSYQNEIEHYAGRASGNGPDPKLHLKGLVSWEFNLFGASVWRSQREADRYLASIEGQRALQMSLIAEVVTAYFELVSLDRQMEIIEQTVAVRRETTEKTRLRFMGGLTSETAYRQAIVEYASAAAMVPDMEKRIALKEHQIAWLAGEFPARVARSALPMASRRHLDLSAGIPSDLLLRRPDVRQARAELDAAMANAGFYFASRFPSIRLSLEGGLENDEWKRFFSSPYLYPIATLTSPLFAFGTNQARYRASVQQYMQQKARYEKTVLTVFREVNDAMVVYRKTCEETMLLENLQEAALKYVELADLQYLNGVISYMDVLDAQRKYFSAQLDLVRNVSEEQIALVQLYKALGGGWNEALPAGALTKAQERRQEKVVAAHLSDSTAARPGLTPEETLREDYRLYLGKQATGRTEKLIRRDLEAASDSAGASDGGGKARAKAPRRPKRPRR